MQTTFRKWGNSLAIRVPQPIAAGLKAAEGSEVDLSLENGALVIRLARPKYNLDDLLKVHEAVQNHSETDWGSPQGREEW